jgi:hypothetical protein
MHKKKEFTTNRRAFLSLVLKNKFFSEITLSRKILKEREIKYQQIEGHS